MGWKERLQGEQDVRWRPAHEEPHRCWQCRCQRERLALECGIFTLKQVACNPEGTEVKGESPGALAQGEAASQGPTSRPGETRKPREERVLPGLRPCPQTPALKNRALRWELPSRPGQAAPDQPQLPRQQGPYVEERGPPCRGKPCQGPTHGERRSQERSCPTHCLQ